MGLCKKLGPKKGTADFFMTQQSFSMSELLKVARLKNGPDMGLCKSLGPKKGTVEFILTHKNTINFFNFRFAESRQIKSWT